MISQQLIKSFHRDNGIDADDLILATSRVKNHAEVLTPTDTVSDMLDMVSKEYGCATGKDNGVLPLDATFLEPSCGTGNFLVQILKRKLRLAKTDEDVFKAVTTIYGIDIQDDNVLESRLRLLEIIELNYEKLTGIVITEEILKKYANILEKNIILGNSLYEGVLRFEEKNGQVVPLKTHKSFKGGMVILDNDGTIHQSNLIAKTETYEQAYFYVWKYDTEPEKSYLYEDEVEKVEAPKSQEDFFAKFASMF